MLVTDENNLETAGEAYRPALMVFFVLCAVSGVHLSWGKTAGGDIVTWVGLELLHRSYQIGISARRAEWFTRWTRDVAASHYIHMRKFEEGLGRVMYVVSALEFERPFLGPLYKFMALHPRNSVRRVPSHVSFILSNLAAQIQESRLFSLCHSACSQRGRSSRRCASESVQDRDWRLAAVHWRGWQG